MPFHWLVRKSNAYQLKIVENVDVFLEFFFNADRIDVEP